MEWLEILYNKCSFKRQSWSSDLNTNAILSNLDFKEASSETVKSAECEIIKLLPCREGIELGRISTSSSTNDLSKNKD
jgi:hypothetical protein